MVALPACVVCAPNPSAMTLDGTNGYIIDGGNEVDRDRSRDPMPAHHRSSTLLATLGRYEATITHGHPDHYLPGGAASRAAGALQRASAPSFRTTKDLR